MPVNPSYLGGWDQEHWGSRPALVKKKKSLYPITKEKDGCGGHTPVILMMAGSIK
jgi:hypothetical protein